MVTSLMSIVLHVEVGNGFIQTDNISSLNVSTVFRGLKIAPLILISTIFRTFSLVIMATFLRMYAIIPMLLICIVQTVIAILVIGRREKGKSFLLLSVPYGIIALISGPILPIIKVSDEEYQDVNREQDQKRIKWFIYDSVAAFVTHSITLCTIFILLKKTSFLLENLSVCTLDVFKYNEPIIFGSLLGLGVIHFLTYLVFRKCCFM